MKLSIIIPLYNAGKYIVKCLDSIQTSDLNSHDYEVIIVNDGSTDDGPEIAQRYAKEHENFFYYTQENQGQSVARNYGIHEANGKYIWFVDSDDYVDAANISSVLDEMEKKDIEICKFNMNVFDQYGNQRISNIPELMDGCVYSGQQIFEKHCVIGSVCNSFFLTKFIKDHRFSFFPGIIHQDSEFSIRSTALANRILYVSKSYYMYRYNMESSTRNRSFDKVLLSHESDAIIAHNIREFAKNTTLNINDALSNYLYDFASSLIKGRVYSYISKKQPYQLELAKSFIAKMKELGDYPLSIQHRSLKEKLLVSLFNCRHLYLSIVKLRGML